jgi:hypothetical protein
VISSSTFRSGLESIPSVDSKQLWVKAERSSKFIPRINATDVQAWTACRTWSLQTTTRFQCTLGNGDGTFRDAVTYPWAVGPFASVAVTDFDGDGYLDVAVGSDWTYGVAILTGHGDGTLRAPIYFGAGFYSALAVAGDFNGDGRPDLAVANGVGNDISVLINSTRRFAFRK